MAEEYVNKEIIAKHIDSRFGEISTPFVVREIRDFPAADVAPKSEVVQEVIKIIDRRCAIIGQSFGFGGRKQGKTIAWAKVSALEELKAELKKKYTERKEDEGK